uniref:DNA-directed RNA polymerase III subunit RPC3 n=1 Tax=Lygus hesperus TaxID=30085 RepID=A0A0A9WE05_LYGHE
MSKLYGDLCSFLVKEHFGKAAQAIHKELRSGPKTYKLILSGSGLTPALVKRSLCILIQYGFVKYQPGDNPLIAEYTLIPDNIILLLRYPRYLTIISDKYGAVSRLIIDTVLKYGSIPASKVILLVWNQIQAGSVENYNDGLTGVRDTFRQLVVKQYLMSVPCPSLEANDRVPRLVVSETEQFHFPEINASVLLKLEKGETVVPPDANLYWRCNFDRFHQNIQDHIMIEAVRNRIDGHAAKFMEILLKRIYVRTEAWATQSNPVPITEIKEETEKRSPHLSQYLDQYIKIIDEDSCKFITRTGEGSVYVNFVEAFRSLATATVESIVEHRFGPKSARIFRLVRSKKYIDQEHLQKIAMIPDKEAKQLTYKLIQGSFLHMHDLKKSSSAGPTKSFYLLHVNFNQVVHVVLEMCYKAVYNTLARADHQLSENFRLIEKFEKLNTLASSMRAQGEDPEYVAQLLEDWITPPEKTLLTTVETMIEKLRLAELYLDETIMVLQLYAYYDSTSMKEKPR